MLERFKRSLRDAHAVRVTGEERQRQQVELDRETKIKYEKRRREESRSNLDRRRKDLEQRASGIVDPILNDVRDQLKMRFNRYKSWWTEISYWGLLYDRSLFMGRAKLERNRYTGNLIGLRFNEHTGKLEKKDGERVVYGGSEDVRMELVRSISFNRRQGTGTVTRSKLTGGELTERLEYWKEEVQGHFIDTVKMGINEDDGIFLVATSGDRFYVNLDKPNWRSNFQEQIVELEKKGRLVRTEFYED